MTTARDIITGAVKLLGSLRKGETLDADEAADGLVALNEMISSWGNSSLLIPSRTWESFNISSGTAYTIGSGQTLNTTRPISIQRAFTRISNIDYPLTYLTDEEYEDISFKSISTSIPEYYTYDNAYPYGTIRLYPSLATSAELHLLSEKPLTEFTTLNTSVDLAPGVKRALRFNLAIDLAPEYETAVSPEVANTAVTSLNSISLAVAKNRPIKYDPAYLDPINIYTGGYE